MIHKHGFIRLFFCFLFILIAPRLSVATNIDYTYDSLNRITKEEHSDGTVIVYTYDAAGNKTSRVISFATSTTTPAATTAPSGGGGGGGGGGGDATTTVANTTSVPAATTTVMPTSTTSVLGTTTTTVVQPPPETTTTTTTGPCPVEQIFEGSGQAGKPASLQALNILRQFRDQRLGKSSTGLMLTALYYKHAGEVAGILAAKPGLSAEVKNVISELLPVIQTTGAITLTKQQQGEITKLLQAIREAASPELRESLAFILAKLESGELLRGVNRL